MEIQSIDELLESLFYPPPLEPVPEEIEIYSVGERERRGLSCLNSDSDQYYTTI